MNLLLPALYGLAGICVYTALHHGLISLQRPRERSRLLFAAISLLVALYVGAKGSAYQADTSEALVLWRRWEVSLAAMVFMLLPWFVADYTEVRPRRLLIGLSALIGLILAANLVLPYGLHYIEMPRLDRFTLPWGEQVADLRVKRHGAWHDIGWLGMLASFAFAIYASVRQYRRGAHRKARMLMLAMALFLAFTLFNRLVNYGLVQFVHTAEFGFLALVMVMNQGIVGESRERLGRMQAMLDHVPAAVYWKDADGRYQSVNHRFEEVFHVTSNMAVGRTDHELFPAARGEAYRDSDQRVMQGKQEMEFEEAVNLDGETRIHFSIKFPLLDLDGRPYAVCGVSTDVTELRKTRQEVTELRHQVWHAERVARTDAIAASLAHELNQPLAAILSNAQAALRFLDQPAPDTGELREILSDIVHDDKRASGVVSGLRSISRRQEMPHARTDIAACVDEVLDLLHGEFVLRNIEYVRDMEPGCIAFADKTLIVQVVLNLVMNAMDAMREQPPATRHLGVTVAHAAADEVRVAIRDSGIGIPEDHLGEVFNAFYTTKAQGLGMGLAVCRSIVESHGGKLWVVRNPGRGVTFFFSLSVERRHRNRA
jgi:PAS domain S-box-containing protein